MKFQFFAGSILVCFSAFSVAANIADQSGNRWKKLCNDPYGTPGYLACHNYTQGLTGGIFAQAAATRTNPILCIPDGVTYPQQTAVFTRYLNNNPQLLHEEALVLFVYAMSEAFPCRSR